MLPYLIMEEAEGLPQMSNTLCHFLSNTLGMAVPVFGTRGEDGWSFVYIAQVWACSYPLQLLLFASPRAGCRTSMLEAEGWVGRGRHA